MTLSSPPPASRQLPRSRLDDLLPRRPSRQELELPRIEAQAFTRLALAGDWGEMVRGYYTEDAVVLPPNAPEASGHAAIEAFFRSFPPLTAFEIRNVELEGAGDLAYQRGRYSMTMTIGGAAVSDSGKYLEILRKQSDGSWRTLRDMFSSVIPLPVADTTKR